MARAALEIAGNTVAPGARDTVELPAGQLYTHTPVNIPVQVIHGRRSGPCLVVTAGVHGDEINGAEIIRRLLRQQMLNRLAGTLIAVPVVNVLGFIGRSRYLPDRRDLNRSFPGSESGSMASRLAYLVRTEVIARATHAIDLHTAAIHRDNLPQIRADLSDAGDDALARAFGLPVVLDSPLIEGSLRSAAREEGVPVITYEGGEALRFNEQAIRAGVKGVIRVMRHLGMLAPTRRGRPTPEPHYIANSSSWMRAGQDGLFRAAVALGDRVRAGQPLGWISDPFGGAEIAVEAAFSGLVIGRANMPLVHEGEALFHVARFDQVGRVHREMERFSESLESGEEWEEEPPIV
ncbi:succinylglutamate desuccinylase/aspartoacylase family protein [Aquisalimonas sp. 2447]|uniref:succinylglutamate desuccinylase/aspartoacylase family protein n=1 Tax=Aquisalimonas sp. 2447 TaxID=2740807 RepID=UPI00143275FC|nr:succinylglutamate desuccinylase/aspartoacylase family protein [Aquisalimonas sp. 2447]QIT53899.1 succinylglutamate desuccinylase/aspartoacylase family protein [Aquisalimonas sp. 2447]